MAGNKVIAAIVPLSDRTFIIGDAELMGYVGCKTLASLHEKFTERKCGVSLKPTSQIGKTKYYAKKKVDEFIIAMNEWQEVHVAKRRKQDDKA